jgi:hypothetical protein
VFGSSSFASAPFAADADGVSIFVSSVEENASVADTFAALVTWLGAYADATSVADVIAVAASVFNAVEAEAGSVIEQVSAQADFAPLYSEAASGVDTPTVSISNFSAAVGEGTSGVDTPVAIATLAASVQNTASAIDNTHGLAPWEVIDDTQPVTWQVIKART